MADDDDRHIGNQIVDQILLRALMREVVMRLSQQSTNPSETVKEICDSLYRCVDGYSVPDADREILEESKERARMNIDTLRKSFDRSPS